MKKDSQAFPYPVLSSNDSASPDFTDSAFQCQLDYLLSDDQSILHINYEFSLSNDPINSLIKDESASFAIEIICSDTLVREIHYLEESGVINLCASNFYGKIIFSPIVVIKVSGIEFTSDDLNHEFAEKNFILKAGDIIALDKPGVCFLDFDNLSFRSLVTCVLDKTMSEYQVSFDFGDHKMRIYAGVKLKKLIDYFRARPILANHLLMSVYKDCFLFALLIMCENQNDSYDLKWMRALDIKLNKLDVADVSIHKNNIGELNKLAQDIVGEEGVRKLYNDYVLNN